MTSTTLLRALLCGGNNHGTMTWLYKIPTVVHISLPLPGQSFCSVAIIQSGDKALRNVCAARTPKLPCPPRSYFNFLQCSATFSYMENSTGPNDELAQMLGCASQILRSYAKTRVCEYPFPNTSQTWHNVLIQGSVVVIRQFLIFINQTFLMVSVALVTMVD